MSTRPHALVTGGSRGIGAAICVALADAGHPILLNYRSNGAAAEEVGQTTRGASAVALARARELDEGATVQLTFDMPGSLVANTQLPLFLDA